MLECMEVRAHDPEPAAEDAPSEPSVRSGSASVTVPSNNELGAVANVASGGAPPARGACVGLNQPESSGLLSTMCRTWVRITQGQT